jgi:4-amino-4-deoxy-L-arabinose transferase-like glycosyltransferase
MPILAKTIHVRLLVDGIFVIFTGFLLFGRLGHYSLWDDETMVALASQGVLTSGDTVATHGENIVAYRSGLLLRDLCDRSTPPLTAYLTAPSIWLFGSTSFAARFPCAVLGFGLMLLVVWLLRKKNVKESHCLLWYIAISGNTSLFLFLRQSRYYAPTIFLVVWISLLYLSWNAARKKNLIWVVLLFALLFAANYMACLALFLCLVFDYVIWKRKSISFPLKAALPWILGSLGFCLFIARIWNPYRTGFGAYTGDNSWTERLMLLFWNFRDTADCQFWVSGLLIVSLFLAAFKKDPWILRGWTALLVFIAVITVVSPQLIAGASVADVRYLAPVIPLGICLSVRTLILLLSSQPFLAVCLSFPLFLSNLGSGAFFGGRHLNSPPWLYIQELITPVAEPYSSASDWISSNVACGKSVWVVPDYMTYPLMFHAPQAIYAWQLRPEQKNEEQFKNLPDIHFQGLVPPDYIIAFGPSVFQIRQLLGQWSMQGMLYQEVTRLMTYWKDLYRPELFWRTFKPIENFDPNTEAIYIFKKQP